MKLLWDCSGYVTIRSPFAPMRKRNQNEYMKFM